MAGQEESLFGASRLLRESTPEGGEGGVEGRHWVKEGGWDRVKVRRGGEGSHGGPSG